MPKVKQRVICLLLLAAAVCGFAGCGEQALHWEISEYVSAVQQEKIREEILQAAECCREAYLEAEKLPPEYSGGAQRLGQADIDAMEDALTAAGFAALDSDETYPTYLANPDGLRDFCGGKSGCQTVFRVGSDGGLQHLFFLREGEAAYFVFTDIFWDEQNEAYVRESETRPVYDMVLSDWGIFYYQIYPEDPHYITYNQIRMEPVNRELYDLTLEYILPVGYQFTNLFLTDWQEGDWGGLSFNDLLEFLYEMNTGAVLDDSQFAYQHSPTRAIIPAKLFEETILPWFEISLEDFRKLSGYDAEGDCYLWRPRFGEDVTAWKYPMCEPEVADLRENSDGTITLMVKVYSPDLKTDRLFAHEVTVRPLDNGRFQYVSNRITYVSDRGLPPNMPRFELDRP